MLLLGQGFEQLCDWTGIIISSFVNFLLPPYLYIKAVKLRHAMIKTRFSGSDMDSGDEQTQVVSNTNRNNSKSNISSSNNQLYRAQNTTTVNEMIGKISQIVTDSVSNATTRTKAKDSSATIKMMLILIRLALSLITPIKMMTALMMNQKMMKYSQCYITNQMLTMQN